MPEQALRKRSNTKTNEASLKLARRYSRRGVHPYDEVTWVTTDAIIPGKDKPAFELNGVEFPDFYSPNAINIIASKYFKGRNERQERSLRQLIDRVVQTFRRWGEEQGYFKTKAESQIFADELTAIVLHQRAWFNSPVWFNVGLKPEPQCSACFIVSIEDSMVSILDWIRTEGLIFQSGSGSGINLSPLRGEGESLSLGGTSSGPISFMKAADAVAGSIKSGGTTRRAAKMVILNADHPDVVSFIRVKAEEENKIRAFIEAGHDLTDMNHPLWQNIFFQNANNSVRLPDEFMEAVIRDGDWQTRFRKTGEIAETYRARDLAQEIARAAWECGDPGVQFDTMIQRWHTCPRSGPINATNPCAEYLFLDNTSCNLGSINLTKYLNPEQGTFDIDGFIHTIRVMFLAQDILIDRAGYPTPGIAETSRKFRTIGLGYANLGALLMTLGIPYDSDVGRAWAGAITALMTGEAYRSSALIAGELGSFAEFEKNREPALAVMAMHRDHLYQIDQALAPSKIFDAAVRAWDDVLTLAARHGLRNAQATVVAPTGTIGLAMDCDTTGVEPDFALVKFKQLVGGGFMTFVNSNVAAALRRLGYTPEQSQDVIDHLERTQSVEAAPHLKPEHLAVFDTAVTPAGGTRSIHWRGHVRMVAAVQPFISGGISKTFNMPREATVDDINEAYLEAWKLGIKCFAVYRDGSKATQALYSGGGGKRDRDQRPKRRRLPDLRQSETHKFSVAGHEGYLTYGMYEDGSPGEIFIKMAKQGSTLSGLLDAFAVTVSIALQYGVPLRDLATKFAHVRFEPMGITSNPEIQFASSIVDYLFRFLAHRFLSQDELITLGFIKPDQPHLQQHPRLWNSSLALAGGGATARPRQSPELSGPPCRTCGGMTIRTGSCHTCVECGESSGGCG